MIRKWTVYTMVPHWKSPLTSVQGNYFSFRCQSDVWRWINPFKQGEQIGRGCHPFIKYSHSVNHVPRYNTTLLLRPPILNFLSATVPSFLPQVACPFQKRHTKIVWSSKQSRFIAWRPVGPESSTQMKFFMEGWEYVALGSLYVFS